MGGCPGGVLCRGEGVVCDQAVHVQGVCVSRRCPEGCVCVQGVVCVQGWCVSREGDNISYLTSLRGMSFLFPRGNGWEKLFPEAIGQGE